jgi:hypothetical protein
MEPVDTGITSDELMEVLRSSRWASRKVIHAVKRFATPEERQRVGAAINPDTALVFVQWRGLHPYAEITFEGDILMKTWFAVDPRAGVAVAFDDIPPHVFPAATQPEITF